ncbi:MAG: replicative DNA helicase [Clostridia bacterium]|nr:replicative DNA helicase [Clostridia bacterium]MBQ2272799.1 replicative DNA helicase [Clostridia bacterium]MBQ5821144.1 replicative DNA helicase [Clostridia bacterium]
MEQQKYDFDRQLPHNTEAEQIVLGSVLLDPESIGTVAEALQVDQFYTKRHQVIFETMLEMYDNGDPIEGVLLLSKLREQGEFTSEDDSQYLYLLAENASSVKSIDYYTKLISDAANLRRVIEACKDITDLSYANTDLPTVLGLAEQRFYDISNGKQSVQLHRLGAVAKEEINRLTEMEKDETGKFAPIKVGISDFDNFLGGLNNSDLFILAARPGVGKTSFALNIAYNIALSSQYNPRKSVVFFSLEMSKEQLARRIISTSCKIESEKLRLGKLDARDWEELLRVWRSNLRDMNFYMDETGNITALDMKSKLRKVPNLGLVVIDYLQLMSAATGGGRDNRVQELSTITRSLKLMAKELNVPVILLSQLSRGIEKRDDPTPQLSDLRDSGSIEQDADIVVFLSRDYYEKDAAKKNICNVHIAKNRHGSVGKISLNWDGRYTAFTAQATNVTVPEGYGDAP